MSVDYVGTGSAGYASSSVFLTAAAWVQQLLTGPLATMIAVVAIAGVGLAMLSGRVSVRRGATVVLGCFVLFGAGNLARGLVSGAGAPPQLRPAQAEVSPELLVWLSTSGAAPDVADPYAGAAFRRR